MYADKTEALAVKVPEIEMEMQNIEKDVEFLRSQIDTLWSRLSPLVRSDPSSGEDEKEQQRGAPLASRIQRVRSQMEIANKSISTMLKVLEI